MSTLLTLLAILLFVALLWGIGLLSYTLRWKIRIEKIVPPRGQFTRISTGKLHYVDRGTGPAILLIHGLGGQLGNFDCGLIDNLARDHRVIAIDRPGMGYSDRPDNAPTGHAENATLMFEVMEALKIEKPIVVGHSLGGAISLAMALHAPEKLRGLALLAPLTLPSKDAPAAAFNNLKISSNWLRWLVAWTLATPGGFRNAAVVLDQIYGPEAMPASAPTQGGGLLGLRPRHFFNTSRDFMASGRGLKQMSENYDGLTLPVRILYGAQDRTLDHTRQGKELVAMHPRISLTLIEGGHMLPVTQPDACADFIRQASRDMPRD
ncbi:alpha/beta hydrolase [Pseudooceanicola sediminis]|uniref:Alpha/beta hydrolase n=1 Tax=Pseudooceanicola sediminis TaxID=2211117 RepID=A0A399J6U9_9RHOB|nr:alpha/beta hydrolase [Pseudooceanicola sediminis]KAA2317359.1 alpha/beta hydrolase [Puniceibacterium sp. HSS470]RII39712.1 alpha/beta hydrolase [Pseudooceanicola sediminis]|tara:strand:+ start:3062 stop:4024 length:963 start_codon:yes stop_codon:yes gene_type:complete